MTEEKLTTERIVRVSVREFVEFLLRSGDITRGGSGIADREAMLAGSRIHRKIQKSRGGAYRAEVALKVTRSCFADPILPRENVSEASGPDALPGGEDVTSGSDVGTTAVMNVQDRLPYTLVIEGRADGIEEDPDGVLIEEIKGIYADPEVMKEAVPVHLAQAKCYAAIYGTQQGLEEIRIRMTYCHMETEQVVSFEESFSVDELSAWFEGLCAEYQKWASFQIAWFVHRDRTIAQLVFPFDYRAGQRDMVAAVYASIRDQRNLFAQAPTGIGKTISAIYPSVRAMGEGRVEKLFYLTAKTIARTVAEEGFSILAQQGLALKALTITAKEKLCPMEACICDPAHCPYADGHYDRINAALYDYLVNGKAYDRESILAVSAKHHVCPYELQLDLATFADAVICDYNYAFDPTARLARYFGETARKGNYLLLVDEAHNLAERGREMFSASLEKADFLRARRLLGEDWLRETKQIRKLRRTLGRLNDILRGFRNEAQETGAGAGGAFDPAREVQVLESVEELIGPLVSLAGQLEELLKDGREMLRPRKDDGQRSLFDAEGSLEEAHAPDGSDPETPAVRDREAAVRELQNELLELFFAVRFFLTIYEDLDEHYLIYGRVTRQNGYLLKLFCVDPSEALQRTLDRCVCAVFFSATLLPVRYYERLLTTRTDNYEIYIPSPFDREKRLLQIGTDVTTRYTARGPALYARIADYIQTVCASKQGNYMVYFPSYRMLEDVLAVLQTDAELHVQRPGMREAEREEFLAAFSEADQSLPALPAGELRGAAIDAAQGSGRTKIGLCVMGGIFAEGIDLAGDKLIGVIVVGAGLPQVGAERELLKRYHDARGESGFDFAYRNPGMNKVLQAAGRVIRTPEDVGVIVLLDERFASGPYRSMFPREWADAKYTRQGEIRAELARFWEEKP